MCFLSKWLFSIFLRRGGAEDNFVKLRGGAGKLSVSHDSVFPGEVPHTRPLSSLASLATLEVSSCSLIQMSQIVPVQHLRAAFSVFLKGAVARSRVDYLNRSSKHICRNLLEKYSARDFPNICTARKLEDGILFMSLCCVV